MKLRRAIEIGNSVKRDEFIGCFLPHDLQVTLADLIEAVHIMATHLTRHPTPNKSDSPDAKGLCSDCGKPLRGICDDCILIYKG